MFKLNDVKFFKSLIQAFSNKKQIGFKIEATTLQMFSIDRTILFINLETKLIDGNIDAEFTINPQILCKYLTFINNDTIFLIEDGLKIINNHSNISCSITIPFLRHENFEAIEIKEVHTRLFIKNYKALSTISGITNYRIEDDMLKIRQQTDEIADEIVLYDTEFVSKSNLNFTCCNDWSAILVNLDEYIEKVRFLFAQNILFVQFILKEYSDSFVEITIPRTIS